MTRLSDEQSQTANRLAELEARVSVLDEAVRVLAWGLEPHPAEEPAEDRAARAAARAHELLLAARK